MLSCRVCGGNDLDLCIDLGLQPWCNNFLKREEIGSEPKYPLRVFYCNKCSTTQLDYTVKKEIMFGDHTYLSGITKSLSSHFKNIANITINNYFDSANKSAINVLDIGSNDGTQLKHFMDIGCNVLGVESSKTTSEIAKSNGIPTINKFFNKELAESIDGKFEIINAAGVFFHLEELHSVTEGIKHLLSEEGIFIVQFLYMKSIVDNIAFDQIYHEHLLYYNLKSISYLLELHGLEIFDAFLSPIHGGSMIAFVTHKNTKEKTYRLMKLIKQEEESNINKKSTYLDFSRKISDLRVRDLEYLGKAIEQGKKIYGFGAPVKGNTLLNYFNLGTETLQCLVEKNKLRKGLYSPGMHIPIVIEDELEDLPDIYYVLAWNFKKEILERNSSLIDSGIEFYFPINPSIFK
ncbi:class I SAM-dependent methyltransferase [Prochlorococcus sp. MIT 1223]|uniref:class I SAM-dependent methyltransferase n=1 Tax=Prochlorococcus sp. MIT 1223 TaxID=3096217 RepID=UPI002A74D609|nr:class I SAM-dependent methyltransferase [Prochlorococcus sp. MIT 1223]